MDEVGIEPTSSIGDALAMRPLRKIPAGILLPLAELVLRNRGFRHLRMATRTLPWTRKPLKRLDLNFYIMIDPTLCVTLALALRSHKQIVSVCKTVRLNNCEATSLLVTSLRSNLTFCVS